MTDPTNAPAPGEGATTAPEATPAASSPAAASPESGPEARAIETATTSAPEGGNPSGSSEPSEGSATGSGGDLEASDDAEGDDDESEGDDDESAAAGPEGPPAEGGDKKKRRRRRAKKAPGVSTGPEGPPLEGAAAAAASAPPPAGAEGGTERRADKAPRGGNKPAPRDRAAFQFGEEVFGRVTAILDNAIMVDLAGKALAIFDRTELAGDDLIPAVGDRFVAQVIGDGSRGGLVVISRRPLREEEAKPVLEKAFEEKTQVTGLITGAIKGGVEVYVGGLRAFAPASHVDLRLGSDLSHLIGQTLPFFVEQYAKRGRDVVLSRRAILEESHKKNRETSLAKLAVGSSVKGVVRSIVQWGAFVAIPSADDVEGLVHISEISHDPRVRAQDALKIGEEIDVKILRIDEKGKLWLSKKATEADPWEALRSKYAPGTRHKGTVARIQPFGAFITLEQGLDGLLATPDLSIKRIEKPEDVIKEGQEIDVIVASMDASTKRIALHPAPPEAEAGLRQRVAPHKIIKVAIVAAEARGLVVRILGATGRHARGFVPAGHTGTPRGTDLRKQFPVNSEHEVKVLEVDPKRGEAKLSVKAVREDSEKASYNEYRASVAKEAKFGTFADLLKKSQQPQ
ncbi:MAG: S1 RNA-binding domain-containing protein [Polyangiaceae bacterium]|jgi:small subunit ribosomal protein S1|nr:S1 RNA-binding domain-containing protein [Polyangiaceae bacterium]